MNQEALEICCSFFKEPGLAVDCGAHYGDFAIALAQRGWTVHALEPHPNNYERLLEQIKEENRKGSIRARSIRTWNLGLSDSRREMLLYDDCPSTICTVEDRWKREAFPSYFKTDSHVRVLLVDWSSFCVHRSLEPDFLKIDAEGHDPCILKNVLMKGPRPRAIMHEYDANDLRWPEVLTMLTTRGYQMVRMFSLDGNRGMWDYVWLSQSIALE